MIRLLLPRCDIPWAIDHAADLAPIEPGPLPSLPTDRQRWAGVEALVLGPGDQSAAVALIHRRGGHARQVDVDGWESLELAVAEGMDPAAIRQALLDQTVLGRLLPRGEQAGASVITTRAAPLGLRPGQVRALIDASLSAGLIHRVFMDRLAVYQRHQPEAAKAPETATARIKTLLRDSPGMRGSDVAELVGVDRSLVYQIMKRMPREGHPLGAVG
jgi:hypothetical protein